MQAATTTAASSDEKKRVSQASGATWLAQVRDLQLSRLSDTDREAIRQRAERQRQVHQLEKKSHAMRKRCAATKGAMAKAMKAMAECDDDDEDACAFAPSAPSAPASASFAFALPESRDRDRDARSSREVAEKKKAKRGEVLSKAKQAWSVAERRHQRAMLEAESSRTDMRADSESSDDDDAGDFGLLAAGMVGGLSRAERDQAEDAAMMHEEGDDRDMEFRELLESFRIEPPDEDAAASKFLLYEEYLATVERVRADVFTLWASAQTQLPAGPVRASVERDIRNIDSEQNVGLVDFVSGRWFVYDMIQKAEQNNKMLSGIMRSIEAKLRLLADQESVECPFCLEQVDAHHPGTLLGCCHRVGLSCWEEWRKFRGAQASCPLCRHEDFVDGLAASAPPASAP